jgi:ABC-type transporter MlaC component
MKRLPALIAIFSLAMLLAAPAAEAPDPNRQQEQQVLAVAKEVQAQQAAIAENQAKMDAKLATIAESLRVARIYATRGGGKTN